MCLHLRAQCYPLPSPERGQGLGLGADFRMQNYNKKKSQPSVLPDCDDDCNDCNDDCYDFPLTKSENVSKSPDTPLVSLTPQSASSLLPKLNL